MNTSQTFYTANATGGKAAPGLAFPTASTSNFADYSFEDEAFNLNLTSADENALYLRDFDPTNASPFTQAFGQVANALEINGLKGDKFTRSVEAQPVLPTQTAQDLDLEAYFAAIESQSALQTQTQSQSQLHASGSSEYLHSPYGPNPGEMLSRAYARSNSGSPSPSHTPSTTTPSQRSYSLSPHTTCLPPNALHNGTNNTVSPIQLHPSMDGNSMSLSPSHSRTNSHAHSRKLSTQSIRDITDGMQHHVQIGPAFGYPVTPQDGPVALPRIASHLIQHAHHRSRSIPALNPLNTVDSLEVTHSVPVYVPVPQQYQYQAQPQYQSPQDQISAAMYHQNPQYLSAVSQTYPKPYLHSDFEDGASPGSGAEESGSSMYSPMVSYGHGRNLSASTSAGSSFGTSAPYAVRNGLPTESSMYGFSPNAQGGNGLHHDDSAPLKRKRSTGSELDECDEEDGDASYDGGSPSADEDDTDYSDDSESKGKKRKNKGHARRPSKRQNTLSGDWDLTSLSATSTSPIQMKSRRSGSGSPTQQRRLPRKAPKLPEGANIKVAALPPISKADKCCPICSHVPGNGRYSDLIRHAKTHLKVPEHYVCVECSIVERSNVDGALEFVEGEVFTRKDSCRRHWSAKHNPTGNLKWEEKYCIIVDRVREAAGAGISPSASSPSIPDVSNVSYASDLSTFQFPY